MRKLTFLELEGLLFSFRLPFSNQGTFRPLGHTFLGVWVNERIKLICEARALDTDGAKDGNKSDEIQSDRSSLTQKHEVSGSVPMVR